MYVWGRGLRKGRRGVFDRKRGKRHCDWEREDLLFSVFQGVRLGKRFKEEKGMSIL